MQKKILIVEDETFLAETLGMRLESMGYAIAYAENGKEALNKVAEDRPDLITMDYMMPEMNGVEATELIKQNASTADIPIIFLTAFAQAEDQQRAMAAGACDYVAKPFEVADLTAKIAKWIQG